jgi:hypothetical protein
VRLGRPGHLALELVTRLRATEVGADLWRGRPYPWLGAELLAETAIDGEEWFFLAWPLSDPVATGTS